MAAAIAASRSAVMSGNRPLDDRERKRFTYFSSLSPMARKIMQDKEKIREKYGPEWARLPPAQQDEIIDRCLVGPSAPAPRDPGGPDELARFPGLRGPTGQKVVRFGDEVGAGGPPPPPSTPLHPPPSPAPVLHPEAPGRRGTCPSAAVRGPRGRGLERRRRRDGRGWEGHLGARGRGGSPPGVGKNRREQEVFKGPASGPARRAQRALPPPGAEGSCSRARPTKVETAGNLSQGSPGSNPLCLAVYGLVTSPLRGSAPRVSLGVTTPTPCLRGGRSADGSRVW